jgi:hypothetical protein
VRVLFVFYDRFIDWLSKKLKKKKKKNKLRNAVFVYWVNFVLNDPFNTGLFNTLDVKVLVIFCVVEKKLRIAFGFGVNVFFETWFRLLVVQAEYHSKQCFSVEPDTALCHIWPIRFLEKRYSVRFHLVGASLDSRSQRGEEDHRNASFLLRPSYFCFYRSSILACHPASVETHRYMRYCCSRLFSARLETRHSCHSFRIGFETKKDKILILNNNFEGIYRRAGTLLFASEVVYLFI